uniref:Uncharacterized protein n=1 Tax=Caenorhabditis tropicalis TaxID=1561998 RepID=A0A1I7U173_9PELO
MADCEDIGNCFGVKNATILAALVEDFSPDFRENAYKTTAVKDKNYLFPVLFPTVVIIIMYLTLPALRRAIFPCCYNKNNYNTNDDRMFLLSRTGSANSSPTPSERSNISTITNQPIVSYPNNAVVPYNEETAQYTVVPMPHMYPHAFGQGYPQISPQNHPQGQPIFFPIPITFYNPALVQNRTNELPAVQ